MPDYRREVYKAPGRGRPAHEPVVEREADSHGTGKPRNNRADLLFLADDCQQSPAGGGKSGHTG